MNRPKIAIDIDDVLAGTTAVLIDEVNRKRGVNLTEAHYRIEADYWGYYEAVWAHHNIDDTNLIDEFHRGLCVDQESIAPLRYAVDTVAILKHSYDLCAVTSRPEEMHEATVWWLDYHFGAGTFSSVSFLNFGKKAQKTKGEECTQLGARWLIDDNVDHCLSAERANVTPILFGDYGWQGKAEPQLQRCQAWNNIKEYFAHV